MKMLMMKYFLSFSYLQQDATIPVQKVSALKVAYPVSCSNPIKTLSYFYPLYTNETLHAEALKKIKA